MVKLSQFHDEERMKHEDEKKKKKTPVPYLNFNNQCRRSISDSRPTSPGLSLCIRVAFHNFISHCLLKAAEVATSVPELFAKRMCRHTGEWIIHVGDDVWLPPQHLTGDMLKAYDETMKQKRVKGEVKEPIAEPGIPNRFNKMHVGILTAIGDHTASPNL